MTALPTIPNEIRDPQANITYRVMAFRQLSRAEVVSQVQQYNAQKKRGKKPRPGNVVEIFSIIGFDDP